MLILAKIVMNKSLLQIFDELDNEPDPVGMVM
jgi:hypothetical protein